MHLRKFFEFFILLSTAAGQSNDICGPNNGKRFYLEPGESGSLSADYKHILSPQTGNNSSYNKCTVEFITCPSCVIDIQFRYLNISRNCGKASVFDSCGCDYVWIYEPQIEDASGEQFCGRFVRSNASQLSYTSQTRTIAFTFIYSVEYGYAFTLDYITKRNRFVYWGYPKPGNMNNASQYVSSPFFPHMYPIDLSAEYIINCESVLEPCRINLIFTDFLLDPSSIVEFFDWNGQRMYVISGNIFRPPVITSNGPSLVVRFYANGATNLGFKAAYSFVLGNIHDSAFKPYIGCGGNVNNLGGGITMMNMVTKGTTLFDCVWIVKPPENLRHRKTHLYVKVATFLEFAGTTELTIRQGVTSNQPSVEILRHPMVHYGNSKQVEHVVPINQGFYIRLRGIFTPKSQLAILYAAFNYKDCFGGSDFLCHNLRCISILLYCDGFDHCGDESDELNCYQDPKDHREFSKIPNFLFPKEEPYSNITTATFVFLTCSFGLIGIILAMALLLYRVNVRAQHQRQIQDHIETIHAILEESVGDIEEEIIVPDEPPDYEPPPEYNELLNLKHLKSVGEVKIDLNRCSRCNCLTEEAPSMANDNLLSNASTSQTCYSSSSIRIPDSPPPAYDNLSIAAVNNSEDTSSISSETLIESANIHISTAGPSNAIDEDLVKGKAAKCLEKFPKYSRIYKEIKKGIRKCQSMNLLRHARRTISLSEENLVRYFSDSELIFNSKVSISSVAAEGVGFRRSFSGGGFSTV
ncbi:unnamed protein product [Phyllotreta striolata]|uniref:CUB domain-containing protein n=1 Tax=Phyllotreta striolata TaxID=444603 RepID=A0A9N9TY06_PHYSR|nr:unnamed protein product [Phyllotreta striolata]